MFFIFLENKTEAYENSHEKLNVYYTISAKIIIIETKATRYTGLCHEILELIWKQMT